MVELAIVPAESLRLAGRDNRKVIADTGIVERALVIAATVFKYI
jgi:hypothetical protein